jgi:hypothetical protein
MRSTNITPPISPVVPPGGYQLKANGSRRTNTARVSPMALPPPAYVANHDDVSGVRRVQRERGGGHDTLPTYDQSLDPETVSKYKADTDNNDVEAGVGVEQQIAQQPRARRGSFFDGGGYAAFAVAFLIGVLVYLGLTRWSH